MRRFYGTSRYPVASRAAISSTVTPRWPQCSPTSRAAARNLAFRVAGSDAATARRCWEPLTGLAAELAAIGDLEGAAVVGACARFLVAMQFSEYGSGRLREVGLTLAEA